MNAVSMIGATRPDGKFGQVFWERLWRSAGIESVGLFVAGIISDRLFGVCVAAVVLVLAGGTTWMNGGIWSPDGAYSRLFSPLLGLVRLAGVSGLLLTRRPTTRSGW